MKNPTEEQKKRVQKYLGRLEYLKSERSDWEKDWVEIAKYMNPRREFLDDVNNKNVRTGKRRYDASPAEYAKIHADGLQGNLVSSATRWFKLRFSDPVFYQIPYSRDWLEDVENVAYQVFQASNYYAAINEFLLDGCTINTADLYTEYDPEKDSIIFQSRSPGEIYIVEDRYGRVKTIFREYTMTAEQMQEKFKDLPEEVKKELEDGNQDEKHTIVHIVGPRSNRDKDKPDSKNMPFESVYIYQDNESILHEGGYEEFPHLVWRYRKNSGEKYGRGPGMDNLEDVIQLNKHAFNKTKLGDLQVDPPKIRPKNMKGRFNYVPGAEWYFSQFDQKPEAVTVPGNYAIGKDMVEDLRDGIRKAFKVDLFLMLQNIERQMTAREVMERAGEKAVVIGAAVGRLYQECLNPLIKRVLSIMQRAGKLPPAPADFAKYGAKIEIELMGPLALSQKNYARSQGITKGMESIIPLAQMNPDVMDLIDFDVLAKESLEAAGMPQKAIKEDHEVKQIRKRKAQIQQQQMQMAQMQQGAEMVPKLNQQVQPGSPLEQMQEQLAAGVQQQ